MIKIGLVGCGFMGRMHSAVYKMLPNAQIVGVADSRPDAAKEVASAHDCPTFSSLALLLEGSSADAIDICLPTFLHSKATCEAAGSSRHVICEKPMALSVEEGEEMAAAAKRNGTRLMVAHCIRFWPEYVWLKQAVDDKRYGDLLSINLTRYGQFPSWSCDNWLADPAKSGGGALDMHIHDTDYALYLLGEPDQVFSRGSADARGVSQVFTTLTYGRTVAHLEGGWNLPEKTPFKMAIRAIFERGAAIMDDCPLTLYQDGKEPYSPKFEKMKSEGGGNISDLGGYFFELRHFVDCLESGNPFTVTTPETSICSLRLTLEEIRQVMIGK